MLDEVEVESTGISNVPNNSRDTVHQVFTYQARLSSKTTI
jgi:hypothetical protein